MMLARSIIEAESPKRFFRHQRDVQSNTLAGWLKREFKQNNPTLFQKPVSSAGAAGLRGNIWVTVYGTSIWYRLVLLYGHTASSPVWGTWEINPTRSSEDGEPGLRDKLKKLTDTIVRVLHYTPNDLGGVAQRRSMDTQIQLAFDAAH